MKNMNFENSVKIYPSMLSANFSEMGAEILKISQSGADGIHWDIMDGNFVDAITFGAQFIAVHRPLTSLRFDAHLMVENPDKHIKNFADAGADLIIVHPETCKHLHRSLENILKLGKKAGVALNPATNPDTIIYCHDLISMVLVMTVNPGASGQKFINSQLPKIKFLRASLPESTEICIDGGITPETLPDCVKSGANSAVSGSYIFKNQNYIDAIENLKRF